MAAKCVCSFEQICVPSLDLRTRNLCGSILRLTPASFSYILADIISTVEFDHTGDYLATGDKGGRVVLFERNEGKKCCEYKFHAEFQSHEPEFDYLKSLEIEEKINKINWCRRQNSSHFLLSTNGARAAE
ncbi:MAG: hypothetical protein BJ554DRAFT_1539 [Olpidium bornovanus]|uniref:Uncharacterized protein n=1 Tax=Olpidium bornovanus TaxID=278681 RepID=A0A8H7ZSI4_9FUNG|nr:MAG: hypothetical protein BJ554DRAFT_1539 [Olpidium bornovanus]